MKLELLISCQHFSSLQPASLLLSSLWRRWGRATCVRYGSRCHISCQVTINLFQAPGNFDRNFYLCLKTPHQLTKVFWIEMRNSTEHQLIKARTYSTADVLCSPGNRVYSWVLYQAEQSFVSVQDSWYTCIKQVCKNKWFVIKSLQISVCIDVTCANKTK